MDYSHLTINDLQAMKYNALAQIERNQATVAEIEQAIIDLENK